MITATTNHEVTLTDGAKETVELKRLTVRQLYQFVEILGAKSSAEAVAVCTGKSIEWVDTLSDESFGELAKQVHEQNFPRAMALSKEDYAMAIAIAPYVSKMLAADGTVGNARSLNLSSRAHTEAILNESSTSQPTGSSS